MDVTEQPLPPAKPLWRRIVEFPLVALLLAIATLVLVLGLFAFAMEQLPLERLPEPVLSAIGVFSAVALVFLAYKFVIRRLGEQPRDDLPLDGRAHDLWRGTLGAALLMSAIVGIVAALGSYRILGWGGSTSWAFILLFGGIQAAFVEEVIVRGIIFRFLEEFGGSWFALALSSLAFGFMHAANDNATLLSSFAIAVEAGVLLGGAYMLTRNLWLAIGLHFGWNVTQGYVWDVAVSGFDVDGLVEARMSGAELISGGAFGLEASVVAMILATAVGVWLVVLAARRGNIIKPWWARRREAVANA